MQEKEFLEIIHLMKPYINSLISQIVYFIILIYLINGLKGFAKNLTNRIRIHFDKNISEDRTITINGIEGYIERIGWFETRVKNGAHVWLIPNEILLNSIKGFPMAKKEEEQP